MQSLTLPETLTLLALVNAGEKGGTTSDIRKGLGAAMAPLLKARAPEFDGALERLVAAGLAEELPRPRRARSSRWRALPAAREALPAHLRSLGTGKRGAITSAARVLAMADALGLSPRATDGVLRRRGALLAWFLARQLGEPFEEATTTLDSLAGIVTARALGTGDIRTETLRRALLQRGLAGERFVPGEAVPTEEKPAPPARKDFASSVLAAARTAPPEAWFGARKVFIHRVFAAWQAAGHSAELDLPGFKARLLAALRRGELALARADFPDAHSPADLAEALTPYGPETYHFLTLDHSPTP